MAVPSTGSVGLAASAIIESTLDGPSVGKLERLGLGAGGLTGDGNDLRLISMVEVLPLLVAEAGRRRTCSPRSAGRR